MARNDNICGSASEENIKINLKYFIRINFNTFSQLSLFVKKTT